MRTWGTADRSWAVQPGPLVPGGPGPKQITGPLPCSRTPARGSHVALLPWEPVLQQHSACAHHARASPPPGPGSPASSGPALSHRPDGPGPGRHRKMLRRLCALPTPGRAPLEPGLPSHSLECGTSQPCLHGD